MKKLYTSFVILCVILQSYAVQVDTTYAKQIAKIFLQNRCTNLINHDVRNLVLHYTKYSDKTPLFYIINIPGKAFVIISGDDRAKPILGYSLIQDIDMSSIPPALSFLLNEYSEQLDCLTKNLEDQTNRNQLWEDIISNNFDYTVSSVSPLLGTGSNEIRWDQDSPYDMLTPTHSGTPSTHPPTGCVATAMGQVMRYWQCPLQGNSSKSYTDPSNSDDGCFPSNPDPSYGLLSANFFANNYNWDDMPVIINNSSPTAQKLAVAGLLRDVGISVEMNYALCQSGAYQSDIDNALEDYFWYSTDADYRQRAWYSASAWDNMMKSDLNAGLPILYEGHSQVINGAGHSWVCDGYDENFNGNGLYYHMNWGWGGLCNAYFTLSNLAPDCIPVSLNQLQGAVFNVHPVSSPISVQITSPSNNSNISGNVTIQASATSTVCGINKVVFFVDNTIINTDFTTPYSCTWTTTTVSNGSYVLIARAYNNAGAYLNSQQISVTVNNVTPPVPWLTLTNTGNIPATVSYIGGTYNITVTNSGTGTLLWSTQQVPTWVHLTPSSGSAAPNQNVSVQIDPYTGTTSRNCNIKFVNNANASNYQYLYINQESQPAVSANWESFYKDTQNQGYQNVTLNTNVGITWQATSTISIGASFGPIVVDDRIILASSSGLICFDLNGNILWTNTNVFDISTYPAVYNNVLFVAKDQDVGNGKLFAINISNGNVIAESSGNSPYRGTIKADASGIYVTNEMGMLFAYTFNGTSFALNWTFSSNGVLSKILEYGDSGPAIFGDYIYINGIDVNSSDGSIYLLRINKLTGSMLNNVQVTDPNQNISYCNTPVVFDSKVYFTYRFGTNAQIRCYSTTFSYNWSYNSFGDYLITPPVCYNSKIYIGDDDGKVYCFNATTGSLVFSNDNGPDIEKGMAIVNNCLVALRTYELDLLSLSDGSEIKEISLNSSHYSPPAIKGNRIICANQAEQLYCISDVFAPIANFSGTPTSGYAPLPVAFTDNSTAGSSSITGRFWDFGDGSTSTETNPNHTYTTPGIYNVTLTVTSVSGSNTKIRSNYINVVTSPNLEFIPLDKNFGDINVSTCSSPFSFILKNSGGGTATGTVTVSNTNFIITGGGGSFSLTNGQTKSITVQFCPTSSGLKTASLLADATPPANDALANLQGNGIIPFIDVIVPDGSQIWSSNTTQTIIWSDNIFENVSINLYRGATFNSQISASTESDGSYDWPIPSNLQPANDYRICIASTVSATISDCSPAFPIGVCNITVLPPNQIVSYSAGSTSFTVTATPGCSWYAQSSQNWCTVPAGSTSGNAPLIATYDANNSNLSRTATITVTIAGVNPVLVTVTQQEEQPLLGFSLSGTITYPNTSNTPLTGISLNLKNSSGATVSTTTTNISGNYVFSNLENGNYYLHPSTTKIWGGVSAADLLFYKRHIGNTYTLTGIFLASGDVNSTTTLTAADVLLISQRIGGIISSFVVGDWLYNNINPIVISGSNVTHNFYGLCYGDANGSNIPAIPFTLKNIQSTLKGGELSIARLNNIANGPVSVPINISQFNELGSFQFSIKYDPAMLQFVGATNWYPGIGSVTYGEPAPGVLTFVWATSERGITINDDVLFNINFIWNGGLLLSDIIFENYPTPCEFGDYDGNIYDLEFNDGYVSGAALRINNKEPDFVKIFPNPASKNLTIESIQEIRDIEIQTLIGQVICSKNNLRNQKIQLDVSDFQPGIYLIEIVTSKGICTKKIIISSF